MKITFTETWINPKIKLGETNRYGKGLFAVAPIDAGEVVLVWGGQYVNALAAETARAEGKGVLQWDENLYSIEESADDAGDFINHSCDSNTWMEGAYTLVARRDIHKGEEVTADYEFWGSCTDYVAWECLCGSPKCRQRVTHTDWRLPEVQKRYQGHFSPLINKRIKKLKPTV